MRPLLSVLVLSEDGSGDALAIQRALGQKMARLLAPSGPVDRIVFEPLPENEAEARAAVAANCWKSKSNRDQPKKVRLRQTIATRLLRSDGVVHFHFDADRVFAELDSSENVAKFQAEVVEPVRLILAGKVATTGEVEAAMTALLRITPCYSIEAWLYQNVQVGLRVLIDSYAKHGEAFLKEWQQTLRSWESDRGRLDEIARPKEHCFLRDRHNAELAQSAFPAAPVNAAGKSFARAVQGLAACVRFKERIFDGTIGSP